MLIALLLIGTLLLLLYVTAAEEWWKGAPPPLRWAIVPLSLMLTAMCTVAVVRGSTHWVLWPFIVLVVLTLFVSLTGRPRDQS